MVGEASTAPAVVRVGAVVEGPALSAAGAALVGAVAFGVWRQGAYYPADFVVFAAAALVATAPALAALVARRSAAAVPAGALAGLGAVGAWGLARALAADRPGSGTAVAVLVALVLGAMAVGARAGRVERAWLARGLLCVGAVVAATAWVGVAWRHWPWAVPGLGVWRGSSTLTYANAAAALLVPLGVVALARAVARPASTGRQLAATLMLAGAGSTLSRGGGLALLVAFGVLAAALGPRRVAGAVAPALAGGVVAVAGLAPSFAASHPPRPLVAVVALAGGLGLTAAWTAGRARRGRWPAALVAAGLVIGLGTVAAATPGGRLVRATRLTAASSDRADEVAATARVIAAAPLVGVGPGRLSLVWQDDRGRWLRARYAHNEYAQVAAELGGPTLLVLLAALAALARGLRRAVAARGGGDRALAAGCAAGLAGLAVHSGADFLWHVPVVPVVAGLLAGMALAGPPAAGRGAAS